MADVHTPDSVKNQLQADIQAANTATGGADQTIHDAVQSLINGYGQEECFWADLNTTTATNCMMYSRNPIYPHVSIPFSPFQQCTELETFEAPYFTGSPATYAFFNCGKLRSIRLHRVTKLANTYLVRQQGVSSQIEEIQLGSVGYPFVLLSNQWNYGNNRAGCTITFYVDAATIAAAQESITNWTSYGGQNTSNCTIVFRNSTTGEVISE